MGARHENRIRKRNRYRLSGKSALPMYFGVEVDDGRSIRRCAAPAPARVFSGSHHLGSTGRSAAKKLPRPVPRHARHGILLGGKADGAHRRPHHHRDDGGRHGGLLENRRARHQRRRRARVFAGSHHLGSTGPLQRSYRSCAPTCAAWGGRRTPAAPSPSR